MVFRGWACWKSWYFWCFWLTFSALIFRWFFDRFWSTFRAHFGSLCRSKIMFLKLYFCIDFGRDCWSVFCAKREQNRCGPGLPNLSFFNTFSKGGHKAAQEAIFMDFGRIWDGFLWICWCILTCFWLSFGMVLDKFPWFSWKALWSVLGIVQACGNHVFVQRIMASRAVLGYLAK